MKNLKLISCFWLLYVLSSCSADSESVDVTNDVEITHFNYRSVGADGSISNPTQYELQNNRIIRVTKGNQTLQEYFYENNSISEILTYTSGVLTSKENYFYENDELVEYKTANYSPNYPSTYKYLFTHTNDTIFSELHQSNDGINFEILSESKIVLVNNDRVYFEDRTMNDLHTTIIQSTYDGNGNPVSEILQYNGLIMTPQTKHITYDSTLNAYGLVMEKTYGRKNLMLLHHTLQNAINHVSVKTLSRNNILTFEQSSFQNVSFEIIHDINANNFSDQTIYKAYVDNQPWDHFLYEFYFN